MRVADAVKLKPGDRVRWTDPDGGACSKEITVKSIRTSDLSLRVNQSTPWEIEGEDGSCTGVLARELELLEAAPEKPVPISRETSRSVVLGRLAAQVLSVTGSEKIAALAQYPHPDDWHLWLVMAEVEDGYVVWMYNAQDGGLHNGIYCTSPHEPRLQLKERAYRRFHESLKLQLDASLTMMAEGNSRG